MDARIMKLIGTGQTFTISDLNDGDVILYGNKLGIIVEMPHKGNDKSKSKDIITLEYNSKEPFNSVPNDEDLLYIGHSKVYTKYFKDATNYYSATSQKDFKNIHAHIIEDIEYLIMVHKLARFLI